MYSLEYDGNTDLVDAEEWIKETTMRFIYGQPIGWLKSLLGVKHAEKVFNYLESLLVDTTFKGVKVPLKVHMTNETFDPIIDDII